MLQTDPANYTPVYGMCTVEWALLGICPTSPQRFHMPDKWVIALVNMNMNTASRSTTVQRLSSRVAILVALLFTMAAPAAAKQGITPVPQVVQAAVSEVS